MAGSATKSCDAGPLQSQIGQKATPSVMEDLRTRSGSATARMLRPGQLVTMEYNSTRLNLIVDDKDVMTAIRCG
ncbi:peptidase inhibitor I78 family protein [Achromobacter arsenitoxydans SY8]|uniref:Peptidase inhibitor I78 family protein n=2 Tax=Achromobacter TaxID=222 RepID=H0FBV1_9BURK|nr:peptidase inhibitor I78 family protein [Achromobacter arsenitoxydans SY8]